MKHPQHLVRLQHPQPPGPTTNHNSERPDLLDQAELGQLYKPTRPSISKDTTTRSHRDYFSGSPCRALNRTWHLTDPCREGSPVAERERSDPAQTPPRAALPDVSIDVGAEPLEAAATPAFHVRTALQYFWISLAVLQKSEPRQCPETPRKWFRPPARGHKRPRTSSPPSPCRPRKRPSPAGRWCE